MKNNSQGRLLAQTCSCRPYQDSYDEVMKICEETGRKPAEVLRDALDEWLLMRRAAATGFVNAFAHRERLGWIGATLLAVLITGFVEKFYFTYGESEWRSEVGEDQRGALSAYGGSE